MKHVAKFSLFITVVLWLALSAVPARNAGVRGASATQNPEAPAFDLSGMWTNDNGEEVKVLHVGQSLTAIFTPSSENGACPYGDKRTYFIKAPLQGATLQGTMMTCTKIQNMVEKCGLTSVFTTTFKATVTQDKITGTYHIEWYRGVDMGDCKWSRDPSGDSDVEFSLTRASTQRLGALTVEAMGEGVAEMLTPLQIELILDASGSMREQRRKVDGRLKIDVAKDVMVQSIESLPNGIEVALRVYGHRIREGQKGDCQDSELVFPFAKIDKPRLIQRVRQIQALGTTPIAYSLQQVAQDFGSAPGEKMVVLVTDGKEECGGNPSAAVAELLAKGLKVRVNVVGFALAEEAVKQEMNRVAELTGGRFFDAKDAKGLRKAIQESLGVPYDVLDPAGTKVSSGVTGQTPIEVPDGIYTIVVAVAGKSVTIPNVRITEKKSTKIELRKEGQEIRSRVVGP